MKWSLVQQVPILHHSTSGNSCALVPKAVCTQSAGAWEGKKDLVLRISRICALMAEWCFWSQGWDKEAGGHCCCTSPHCCKLFPLWLKWLPWDLKGGCLSHPFFVLLSFPLQERQTLKIRTSKNNCIYRKIYKVTAHAQGKVSAQKRLEEALNLHLRLIVSTETDYSALKINHKTKHNQQTVGKVENPVSRVFTLFYSNVQFSATTKKSQGMHICWKV